MQGVQAPCCFSASMGRGMGDGTYAKGFGTCGKPLLFTFRAGNKKNVGNNLVEWEKTATFAGFVDFLSLAYGFELYLGGFLPGGLRHCAGEAAVPESKIGRASCRERV